MKLKHVTAIVIVIFSLLVIYFIVTGYIISKPAPKNAKPSPATIQAEIKAAKSGLFEPPKPAIIH